MTPLRVGIAGVGQMGRNHLRALAANPLARVVAVADPDPAARAAARAVVDIEAVDDPIRLLEHRSLDALIVATPTRLHAPVASAALECGVAVLVEKPLAASLAEAEALARLVARVHGTLQVGHIERFNPAVEVLHTRLSDGALSRIHSVTAERGGPLPGRVRDVGVVIDLATHDVDLACHLLGDEPRRVYAEVTRHVHTEHEDLLHALLVFGDGVIVRLDVDWLRPRKQRTLRVLGPEGMFELDYLAQSLRFTPVEVSPTPTLLDGYAPTCTPVPQPIPVVRAEPLARELDAFLRSVSTGSPPPVSVHDGVRAVALAEALLRSAAEHRAVAFPLDLPGAPA